MKDQLKEKIFDLISNNLVPDKELSRKIEADQELMSYYEQTKALHEELFRMPVHRPNDEYWQTLTNSILDRVKKKQSKIIFLRPVLMIAASILLFMSGFMFSGFIKTDQIQNNLVTKKSDKELQQFFHKSSVVLTTFVNMDREESEILPLNIFYGNQLLKTLNEFQEKYTNDPELLGLLDEMERIIIMIQSLKDKPEISIKNVQNGIERVGILNRLSKLNI